MSRDPKPPPDPDLIVDDGPPVELTDEELLFFHATLDVDPNDPSRLEDDPRVLPILLKDPGKLPAIRRLERLLRAGRTAS